MAPFAMVKAPNKKETGEGMSSDSIQSRRNLSLTLFICYLYGLFAHSVTLSTIQPVIPDTIRTQSIHLPILKIIHKLSIEHCRIER
jgi:hypothetical protein